MISFTSLIVEGGGPVPQQPYPQQYINYNNQQQVPPQQPGANQKPSLWNRIKQGYNNLDQKYNAFMGTVKDIGMMTLPMVGSSLMMANPNPASSLRTLGMGLALTGNIINMTRVAKTLPQRYQQNVAVQQQQAGQQPINQIRR